MKNRLNLLSLALLLCSCAATSVEKSWKSPTYQGGPVHKVAVLAVSDQGMIRTALENRVAGEIRAHGQAAIATADLLALPQIQQDKAAAAARLRQEGVDSILITRLVGRTAYDSQVRMSPHAYGLGTTGYDTIGWYDYYSYAFTGMDVSYATTRDYIVLDSSLFDLSSGKRLWSVVTQTVVKEDVDRLVLADKLAAMLAERLLKDGMIH